MFRKMARLWKLSAQTWRIYMRRYASTYRTATRTGHQEAAATALLQAVTCREQSKNAMAKAAQCMKEAA